MKRLIIGFLVTFMMFVEVMAQKTCVVANAEDHVPIKEALIHTNNNHWARTDYRGYWSMKYQFDSATVSKSGFLKTTVYLKELPDTVFLIPESTQLGTVEVWGKDQQHVKDMEDQVQQAASMIGSGTTGVGFDLGKMLDSRGRRDQKHLRNARKILGKYDKKDPIEDICIRDRYLLPFLRLHSLQSIWQFLTSVLPPSRQGVIWSPSMNW